MKIKSTNQIKLIVQLHSPPPAQARPRAKNENNRGSSNFELGNAIQVHRNQ